MDNIIQDFCENSIKKLFALLGEELRNRGNFSNFVLELKKKLDVLGVEICKVALESADEAVRLEPNRKAEWIVDRKDVKTLLTVFGEVKYQRTYYRSKNTGKHKYLSDEFLGISSHDRIDMSLKARLVDKAVDTAYGRSGKEAVESAELSSQTVMNTIREIKNIPNLTKRDLAEKEQDEKIKVKYLYIEADEGHVSLQDGGYVEPRLIYVHEGSELISKHRNKLKNIKYFSGIYANSDELWLEVVDYIYNKYDIENIDKIFISGDGARWIKEGLGWIPKGVYLLDRFHLSKYIMGATAQNHKYRPDLWKNINTCNLKGLKKTFKDLISDTENENKIKEIKECRKYINNNWEGIVNYYNYDKVTGCSAEGHVSHILSDRLSSRPLGWSIRGVDQIARLRAYTANGGKIYNLFKEKADRKKRKKCFYLSKKSTASYIKNSCLEKFNNIEVLNIGKKTRLSITLKALRGA